MTTTERIDPRLATMAQAMARAFMRRLPRNVSPGDIEQAAIIGLLDGLRKHPGGSGPTYEWYLRCRIRGEIIDELRRQDWSGRRRQSAVVPRIVRFDDLLDGYGKPRQFATDDESPEDAAITRCDAAKAWSTPLQPRDTRIMRACFDRGLRQKDVGTDESVSEARISQRVSRSLAGMKSHLTGAEASHIVPSVTRLAIWKQRRRFR